MYLLCVHNFRFFKFQDDNSDKISFKVRDKKGGYRKICEASFLIILGLINNHSASNANNMWKAYKKIHFDPATEQKAKIEQQMKAQLGGRQPSEKFRDAEEFLKRIMRMYGDSMPTKEGTNKDGKTVWIVPYETQGSLYQEYIWEAKILKKIPKKIAKKTCFKKVFKSLEDEIRLLGCKGVYFQY
jgi:hypothetical protein